MQVLDAGLQPVRSESRAELGRSLLVQVVYIVVLSLLLLLVAHDLQARGVWLFAAAVAIGEFCRFAAYLHLTRRLLRFGMVEVIRSLLPGLFAAAVVGLALGLVRITLSSETSSPFALLAAEFLVGILSYAIGVRLWPLPDRRRELWSSASAFGVLGRVGRWRVEARASCPRCSTRSPDRATSPRLHALIELITAACLSSRRWCFVANRVDTVSR